MVADQRAVEAFLRDFHHTVKAGGYEVPKSFRDHCIRLLAEREAGSSLTCEPGHECRPWQILMHYGALEGSAEMVRALLAVGVRQNLAIKGFPPLFSASLGGHLDVMRILLEAGADKNQPCSASAQPEHLSGYTPLLVTASEGYLAAAHLLVESGADIEKADGFGFTPICRAAEGGHADTVRMLAEAGADLDRQTATGFTPLTRAAYRGHLGAVRALVVAGADINKTPEVLTPPPGAMCCGLPALAAAAAAGRGDVMRFLLWAGADLEAIERPGGRRALYVAAAMGDLGAVRLLVEFGANMEAATATGRTPLFGMLSTLIPPSFSILFQTVKVG